MRNEPVVIRQFDEPVPTAARPIPNGTLIYCTWRDISTDVNGEYSNPTEWSFLLADRNTFNLQIQYNNLIAWDPGSGLQQPIGTFYMPGEGINVGKTAPENNVSGEGSRTLVCVGSRDAGEIPVGLLVSSEPFQTVRVYINVIVGTLTDHDNILYPMDA